MRLVRRTRGAWSVERLVMPPRDETARHLAELQAFFAAARAGSLAEQLAAYDLAETYGHLEETWVFGTLLAALHAEVPLAPSVYAPGAHGLYSLRRALR